MIVYLPSCKFTAMHPETSSRFVRWLEGRDVHIHGCCKSGVSRFGAGDTVLCVCLSCLMTAEENAPDARSISVYEYLLEQPDFPWPDLHGEHITVQDCFRARSRPALREAARECLRRCRAEVAELPDRGETCEFDGVFLMNPIPTPTRNAAPKAFDELSRHVRLLAPEEQTRLMREHAAQISTKRVVAVCNGCESGLKRGGANATQLLDLIASRLEY